MRIIIAGGSGLIGRHLTTALVAAGHTVIVLTRAYPEMHKMSGERVRYVHWDIQTRERELAEVLADADGIINLAGANIGSRPWSKKRKADLLSSRIQATKTLVRAMKLLGEDRRPRTLVNASGLDFYGGRGDEVLTEQSKPGDTFLGRVCVQWEEAATAAEMLGVRVVLMRTAVVLATDAPVLQLLALPSRLFLGGPIGDGRQWFPWIHIADLVALFTWALETTTISGPVNAVAPDICTQAQMAQALGTILARPYHFRTPGTFLRLIMGEQADLLLHSRRAIPEQALAYNYTFRFPELSPALRDCLQHNAARETTPLIVHSPFFPVLAAVEEKLPEALHDQYLVRPSDPYRVVLAGIMDRIWHRPFWLWPLLRLCAVFDILFPEQGRDIKASMRVEGRYDRHGGGIQTWERAFLFDTPRHFNATMVYDVRLAHVVEHMAPFGLLEVMWDVKFKPPATIRIKTCGIRLGINRFRFTLPRWLGVEVLVNETALVDQHNTIAVDLVVRHPWLGDIFGYSGQFHVRREMKVVSPVDAEKVKVFLPDRK